MFADLRLRTGASYATITPLTQIKDLSFDAKYNDIGSINFTLTQAVCDALGIGDQSVIEVLPDGQTGKFNTWYEVEGTTGSKTADDTLWKTMSGKGLVNWLNDAKVYPSAWPNISPTGGPLSPGQTTALAGHSFQTATPGFILKTLIARAVTRGALTWLDASTFTGTTDSAGNAWATTLSINYSNGQSYMQVLADLAARGLVSFRMLGAQLQVFNYDSFVTHRTADAATFRRAKNLLEQTSNTDSSNWASAVLYQGDQNIAVETASSTVQTAIGRRREAYSSTGGITDQPTLGLLGAQQIALLGHVKNEESVGAPDSLRPWIEYDAGDWVWEDKDGTLLNLQVLQQACVGQDEGNLKIALTLGDMLASLDAQVQRRLDSITGANAGSYGALPNSAVVDYMAPNPPTSIGITATPYLDQNGNASTQCTITWSAPTINVDGTALLDLDHYEIQAIIINPAPFPLTAPTSPWSDATRVTAPNTTAFISNIPNGAQLTIQVRAVDTSGNASSWTVASSIKTPNYTTTPATPSTPVVTANFQGIVAKWDGLTSGAAVYPTNFDRIDVHVSVTSGFTPSGASLAGSITSRGGQLEVPETGYGTTYYVKFLAQDGQGNTSAASAQASGTPSQLSDPDLPAQLVTGAKIAQNTVNATNLTVGSFGDSVVPNGTFEDASTLASETAGASMWLRGATGSCSRVNTFSISGTWSMVFPYLAAGVAQTLVSMANFPVTPGDIYYFTCKGAASRTFTSTGTLVDLMIQYTANGTFTDLTGSTTHITSLGVTTAAQIYEGQMIVPATAKLARVAVTLLAPSDSALLTFYLDDLAVRPIVGTAWIANASINNAKIANVAADKITVGSLLADVTVSARIKTADTGARVELNSTGLQVFDAAGNQTLFASDLDGSVVIAGTLQVPSVAVFAANTYPGQTTVNQDGLAQTTKSTHNTVPAPGPGPIAGYTWGAFLPYSANTIYSAGAWKVFPETGATGGTWKFVFNGVSSAAIAYNATAATAQTAIQAMSNIGAGNFFVTSPATGADGFGASGGGYIFSIGPLLQNRYLPLMWQDVTLMTGTLTSTPRKYVNEGQNFTGEDWSNLWGADPVEVISSSVLKDSYDPLSQHYLMALYSSWHATNPGRRYGRQGVRISNPTSAAGAMRVNIGYSFSASTLTGYYVNSFGATTSLLPSTQYIVSWYALGEIIPGTTGFVEGTNGYVDGSLVKVGHRAYGGGTISYVKSGIDGWVANDTPQLDFGGMVSGPPTVWRRGTPGDTSRFDLHAVTQLITASGGSNPSGPTWGNNTTEDYSPQSDHGYKRFFTTFTTPSSINEGESWVLELPGPCTSAGGVDTKSSVFYNAIMCEAVGTTTTPTPTRYCDADEPQCTPSNNGGHLRNTGGVVSIPTYADTYLRGRVDVEKLGVGAGEFGRRMDRSGQGVSLISYNQSILRGGTDISNPRGGQFLQGRGGPQGEQNGDMLYAYSATGWMGQAYDNGNTYSCPGFKKDADGWVHLQGLFGAIGAPTVGSILMQLPQGYAPDYVVDFVGGIAGSYTTCLIAILPNGNVILNNLWGGSNGYICLDGIVFWAGQGNGQTGGQRLPLANAVSDWTSIPAGDFQGGWVNGTAQPGRAPARWRIDSAGWLHLSGTISNPVTTSSVATSNGTAFTIDLPQGQGYATDVESLQLTASLGNSLRVDFAATSSSRLTINVWNYAPGASGGFISLEGLSYFVGNGGPAGIRAWQTMEKVYINSWAMWGAPYATARVMRDSLGVVHWDGLVANTVNTALQMLANMPRWAIPPHQGIFPASTASTIAGAAGSARLDIAPAGSTPGGPNSWLFMQTVGASSTCGYVALGNISYIPDR